MSATVDVKIAREIQGVWNILSNPELFARVFEGVVDVSRVTPQMKTSQEQVALKGEIGGRPFLSNVILESKDDNLKRIAYKSGSTLVEITLKPDPIGTALILKQSVPDLPPMILKAYATSLSNRLKQIIERSEAET